MTNPMKTDAVAQVAGEIETATKCAPMNQRPLCTSIEIPMQQAMDWAATLRSAREQSEGGEFIRFDFVNGDGREDCKLLTHDEFRQRYADLLAAYHDHPAKAGGDVGAESWMPLARRIAEKYMERKGEGQHVIGARTEMFHHILFELAEEHQALAPSAVVPVEGAAPASGGDGLTQDEREALDWLRGYGSPEGLGPLAALRTLAARDGVWVPVEVSEALSRMDAEFPSNYTDLSQMWFKVRERDYKAVRDWIDRIAAAPKGEVSE